MAEQEIKKELSEEDREKRSFGSAAGRQWLKQMAAQMRAREYQGLSEEEIQERERQKEMRRKKKIAILEDTLPFWNRAATPRTGRTCSLPFHRSRCGRFRCFCQRNCRLSPPRSG